MLVDDSVTETVEDFLEEAIETVRVYHGNSSMWRGEGMSSRSVLGQKRNESSSLRSSKEGEKSPSKSSTAGSPRLCLSMKRSSAAVAGKSQLSLRALDRDGKRGRLLSPSVGAAGATSGVTTATCDVAGDMILATEDDGAFGSGGVDESSFGDATTPAAGKNLGSNGSTMAFSSSQQQQTGEHDEDESVEIALCRFTRLCDTLECNGETLHARACWSKPTIDDKSSQWNERLMPNFRWVFIFQCGRGQVS